MTKDILVFVAHSDDETLGLGGTIAKHVSMGDRVYAVSMTNGVGARASASLLDASSRKEASEKASEILNFKWLAQFDFEDNRLDKYPMLDLVAQIENVKNEIKPNLVYTHSAADLNVDHRQLALAVMTAFRPQPCENCSEIRLFEVPSATDFGHRAVTGSFNPNLFVEIADFWHLKLKALQAYADEMRTYPHSRSLKAVENLASARGNQVGLEMAEAFEIVRKIERNP